MWLHVPKVESQLAILLPSPAQSSNVSLQLAKANVTHCLASLRSRHDNWSSLHRVRTAGNHYRNGARRSRIGDLHMGIDNWWGHSQTSGHCPNRCCATWLRCWSRFATYGLRRWLTTHRFRRWLTTYRFRRWLTTHWLRCRFTANRFWLRRTTFCRFLAKESLQKSSRMSFARHGSSQACNKSNTTNFPQSHVRLQTNCLTDETKYALVTHWQMPRQFGPVPCRRISVGRESFGFGLERFGGESMPRR